MSTRPVRVGVAVAAALGLPLAAQQVVRKEGRTEAPVAAAAPVTGRVEGLVVDSLSQPIAAADVWVVDSEGTTVARTKADGGGVFVLGRVPMPEFRYWQVHASAPGRLEATDYVAPRQGVGAARLQLFDAARLAGRVVDEGGKGIAGAEVVVAYNRSRVVRSRCVATTDAEGGFVVDAAPLGLLDVSATAPGCECGETTVHVTGAAEGEAPVTVRLEPGEGLPLAVEVAGLSAEEAVDVRVRLLPYRDGGARELPPRLVAGRLDADGKWRAQGLPKAQYRVSVTARDLSFEPREVVLYQQHRGARMLGPAPEATSDPVARFRAFRVENVTLRGKVVDDAGQGLAGETVVARAANGGREATARTADDGTFTLVSPLAPGVECVFYLRESTWITAQEPQMDQGYLDRRDLLWHRAKVDPAHELVLRCKRPAVVRGRLVDGEGQPVRWTQVTLEESSATRHPTWMYWTRTLTAADGTFSFRVTALEDAARVAVEGPQGAGVSAELQLRWGDVYAVGDIVLTAPATIAGVVRGPRQDPVPGARVWLRDWDFGTNQQKSGSVVETVTDRQGRYRFVGVPPGGAWLQVTLDEAFPMDRAAEPFEVKSGDALEFDLVLK
ncbi:MAG: carboxypeptidase-like regulatory domain-containing protein [Planctomycetota bacterium]